MAFNNNNNINSNEGNNYPGSESVPTSFNAPTNLGGQDRSLRDESVVEPQSYIAPDGTNLNTNFSSGLGTRSGPEDHTFGPTGGNIETFGESALPTSAGSTTTTTGATGSMGKHEWTDRTDRSNPSHSAATTKPTIGDKIRGQAEMLAGRVAGNPEMVERGQESKTGGTQTDI